MAKIIQPRTMREFNLMNEKRRVERKLMSALAKLNYLRAELLAYDNGLRKSLTSATVEELLAEIQEKRGYNGSDLLRRVYRVIDDHTDSAYNAWMQNRRKIERDDKMAAQKLRERWQAEIVAEDDDQENPPCAWCGAI